MMEQVVVNSPGVVKPKDNAYLGSPTLLADVGAHEGPLKAGS